MLPFCNTSGCSLMSAPVSGPEKTNPPCSVIYICPMHRHMLHQDKGSYPRVAPTQCGRLLLHFAPSASLFAVGKLLPHNGCRYMFLQFGFHLSAEFYPCPLIFPGVILYQLDKAILA